MLFSTDKIEVNGTESGKPQPPAHSMEKGVLAVFQGSPREKVGGRGMADFFLGCQIGSSVGKESTCNAGDDSGVEMCWKMDRLPTPVFLGFPVAQLVKNPPAMWETWVQSLVWEDPLRRERLPTPVFWPRKFHGLYSLWGRKELDTTEGLFTFKLVFSASSVSNRQKKRYKEPSLGTSLVVQ